MSTASDHQRSIRERRAWDAAVVSAELGASRLEHLATATERSYPAGHPQRAEAERARSYAEAQRR